MQWPRRSSRRALIHNGSEPWLQFPIRAYLSRRTFDSARRRSEPRARDWSKRLVRGLSHMVKLLNPDLIIVDGSVGPIFSFVARQIRVTLRATLQSEDEMPRIEMSEFEMEGPTFGAALLMRQRMPSVDERAATRAALCAP